MAQGKLSQNLYDSYQNFFFSDIQHKRFSHEELMSALSKFDNSKLLEISEIGKSVDGREIKLIKLGNGKVNVLAWSQMHGDESTATMALLDFLNFMEGDDSFNIVREQILNNITLYIIPMLNPDGAEKFRRRNEIDIDINRDAVRLQSPESKILKSIAEKIKPEFAFNLHDQGTRYTVGNSYKVATISFLTPAFNYEKNMNHVRENSMKLISLLTENLNKFIPGHIAKYSDDFEPRAFGDNFVKWGSSLVLIESGGWKNNYDKKFIRKLNFIALTTGFAAIGDKSYKDADINVYKEIPENQKRLFDLLLRNVTIRKNDNSYIVDIGINQVETGTKNRRDFFFTGKIEDIGDLSTFYGFNELDCSGYELDTVKIYHENFSTEEEISNGFAESVLEQGYGFLKVDSVNTEERYTKLPINISVADRKISTKFGIGKNANFVLLKDGKLRFNIINGFLFDVETDKTRIQNGIIYR